MLKKLAKLINKPELVFVCLASFFGVASIVFMPALAVPDENQHFQVSYAIFSSKKTASSDLVLNESMVLSAVRDGQYKELLLDKTSAQADGIAINTGSYVFDGKTKASVFDIMHLPQAIGILIGRLIHPSIGVMVLAGRLVTLAVYIIGLYLIIKNVRYFKWTLIIIACLPMSIQQAASLSYDPINLLAIFAWMAFIINLVSIRTINPKYLFTGLILAGFLILTKANNVLLLALLLAIPLSHISKIDWLQRIRTNRFWIPLKYFCLIFLIIFICFISYFLAIKLLAGHSFDGYRLGKVLLNTFFWGDLGLIDTTTTGIVGQFSNFYYHLPVWIVTIAFIVLSMVMLSETFPSTSRKLALISLIVFISSVLLITVGMYYGWAMRPVRLGPNALLADGIQGRYFTALLVILIPAFAYAQKYIKIKLKNQFTLPVLSISCSVFLLSSYLLQTWHFFWK